MEKQFIQFKVHKGEDGAITIVASDETKDRMGEVIPLDTWDLKNYKKNPVLLVDHDYKVSNIVGRAKNIKVTDTALTFTPEFHEITQLSKEVKEMVESDYAPAVSVGFMPHQPTKDGEVGKNELLEVSFVSVPANPNALALAMKSIDDAQIKQVEDWAKEEGIADNIEEVKAVDAAQEVIDKVNAELKEGRVLSGKNRTKITECSNALKQAAELLDNLLEATDSSGNPKASDEQKVETTKVEHEASVPKKAPSLVVRALQDANRISNILLSELKKPVQS